MRYSLKRRRWVQNLGVYAYAVFKKTDVRFWLKADVDLRGVTRPLIDQSGQGSSQTFCGAPILNEAKLPSPCASPGNVCSDLRNGHRGKESRCQVLAS